MPESTKKSGRQLIIDAYAELLALHPDADIHVKEICSAAGVSRTTFYNHFRDVNDVLDVSMEQFFDGYEAVVASVGEHYRDGRAPLKNVSYPYLDFLYENRLLMAALLNSEKGGDFRIRIADAMGRLYLTSGVVPKDREGREVTLAPREQQYVQSVVGYMWVGVFDCWARSSFRESADEFYEMGLHVVGLDFLPVK